MYIYIYSIYSSSLLNVLYIIYKKLSNFYRSHKFEKV